MTAKVRLFDEVHKFFQIFILEEQIIICTFAPKITNDDTTSLPYILYRN